MSPRTFLTDLCGVSWITCWISATFSKLRLDLGRPLLLCRLSSTDPVCCSKSINEPMHLKVCESVIDKIFFLHHANNSNWRLCLKIKFNYFCCLLFWRRHLEKQLLFDDVIYDVVTSKFSRKLRIRETYDSSLYNGIKHLIITSGMIYLFNFKTVSDILDHPVFLFHIYTMYIITRKGIYVWFSLYRTRVCNPHVPSTRKSFLIETEQANSLNLYPPPSTGYY
jgi:hypothetical protein